MKRKNFRKLKNKHLLIPFEDILKEMYDTPEKMREFERSVDVFRKECRVQILKELGEDVKKIRKKTGVTQEELAARIGTKKSVISRIEHGDQNLTVDYIIKIAVALDRPFEVKIH